MKKIFITGATGFIGSHLSEMCVKKGYRVVAFDRYNSNNDYGWLKNSQYLDKIELILGDIRDYDSVFKSLKNCDTIFSFSSFNWYSIFLCFAPCLYKNQCRGNV